LGGGVLQESGSCGEEEVEEGGTEGRRRGEMAVKTGTFNGANVFLSRNLVPPEMFDALHDALRLNGAQVFLCCDPSRNSPSDYHVISSPDHEKFEDLRAKGCNLLGPHCVLSCAKERRSLPKLGYTCCLAMDGVKVLASGFEKDEKVIMTRQHRRKNPTTVKGPCCVLKSIITSKIKMERNFCKVVNCSLQLSTLILVLFSSSSYVKIEELVTAMGGALVTKAALDVSFVIAKHVLTAKYKWEKLWVWEGRWGQIESLWEEVVLICKVLPPVLGGFRPTFGVAGGGRCLPKVGGESGVGPSQR
ncbi:hypothetical protein Taro_036721, partial [Colocasia esculenta]|nr:hypothetical protein [Colocasia esculenta]